jgi:hypothetical protein
MSKPSDLFFGSQKPFTSPKNTKEGEVQAKIPSRKTLETCNDYDSVSLSPPQKEKPKNM